MLRRALLGLVALLLVPLAACGGSGNDNAAEPADTGTPTSSPTSPMSGTCSYPVDPRGAAKKVDLPPSEPAYSGTVNATIATSIGDLHVALDATHAPCTVNSFLSLAKQSYYDGSSCHRMGDQPGFQFLQCGDPTGTGTGGPGYTIPDELNGSETYPAGTVAMANTGAPNSGGGQFFMVFGDSQFSPAYTVFGKLDPSSVKLLADDAKKGIANPGLDGSGAPRVPVRFEKITTG